MMDEIELKRFISDMVAEYNHIDKYDRTGEMRYRNMIEVLLSVLQDAGFEKDIGFERW